MPKNKLGIWNEESKKPITKYKTDIVRLIVWLSTNTWAEAEYSEADGFKIWSEEYQSHYPINSNVLFWMIPDSPVKK